MAGVVGGIYEIVNLVNGHRYIGSSVNIQHRWSMHISAAQKNKHHSIYFQRAWKKYGAHCFSFCVLECCEKENLIDREQYYIDLLKPNYNISPKAGSSLGRKHTEESKKKNAIAHMGNSNAVEYMRSPEARAKFSAIHRGKTVSKETRAKISAVQKGHIASVETRAKMRASLKDYSGEKNINSKLTHEKVAEIRSRYIPRMISQRKLAKEYCVDQQVIWAIVNNKTWRVEL